MPKEKITNNNDNTSVEYPEDVLNEIGKQSVSIRQLIRDGMSQAEMKQLANGTHPEYGTYTIVKRDGKSRGTTITISRELAEGNAFLIPEGNTQGRGR